MLSAAVFLPLLNAAVKYLSGRYPVLELLWARYAGHLAFMLVVFAPRPNPAEVHAAPSPGEPVDLVLCVDIRDVLRPWLCAARHRRRDQLHRAPDRHRSGALRLGRAGQVMRRLRR